jgi:superfamily II DNA or RNA helicase
VVNSAPDGRRWLIADDVGLGKTIEAGMIMEVLRKRTLGRFRCLVVTPAGLRRQWQEEMERRFNRHFGLFESSSKNELEHSNLLVASIDTLKRKEADRALQGLTPWNLVIFDEAHHLATETSVQKHDLARRLHDRGLARNTIFLTATPHSGNVEHFYNMLRLLRADLFQSKEDVTRGDGRLNQVMLRNRKSEVTDASGERIFKGIHAAKIRTCTPTDQEVRFYEELLLFVRKGYGVARTLKTDGKDTSTGNAVGFLMATFRKLASSSRRAIQMALQKRLDVLKDDESPEFDGAEEDERFQGEQEEKAAAKKALERVSRTKGKVKSPIRDEMESIQRLLKVLGQIDHPDTKLTFFVQELKNLPDTEKVLVFTEYRGTQLGLVEELERAFGQGSVGIVHGSLTLEQRQDRVRAFNELPEPRFLVSTEAGGEGLNMQQSCHIVFNYDLPWNPVRLQQRIGRVYRYGQKKPVQVYNVRLESTSEAFADARIDEYLRNKIREITARLAEVQGGKPEDIENDVLGQVAQSVSLDELYEQAVMEGEERAKQTINEQSDQLRQILEDPKGTLGLFEGLRAFDITDYQKAAARVPDATLDFFIRQYLARQGEGVVPQGDGLVSFSIPASVKEAAARAQKTDPYEAQRRIEESRVERATVSKAVARAARGARLLRFGDPVFDAMARHVQDSDFSDGVASIQLAREVLGWAAGQKGVLAVFDLKVLRQDASMGGAYVLRDQLASFTVSGSGAPADAEHILERLDGALAGDLTIDLLEVRRAYEAAKHAAEANLTELYNACVEEYGSAEAVLKQADDFALAWVEAI